MTPFVLLFLNMGLTTPLYGVLELPWKAVWLQRPLADPLGALRYLEVAHREVFFLPLLWCLVVDDLIARCNVGGVYTQGYMDGICLLVVRKFPNTVAGFIQWAFHIAETWYDEVGLSVNPDKTGLVVFTRRR